MLSVHQILGTPLTALSGGVSASFAYDALNRRRSKTISGTSTRFLYEGWNFVQEQTSIGAVSANLLSGFGLDETFSRTGSTGMSALLVDALGSTQELADASGVPQTHYTYEPFGTTSASGGASTNAAQFTGRENDGTGLYYYRARYLSSSLQRFVSEDPAGFGAGDPNLYAYTFDAPTRWRDPSGRFVVPLLLCAAGAAGSALADAMGGRKFNAVNAAAWCAAGLGLGFAGPAIGAALGYGVGVGLSAATAAMPAIKIGIDAIQHIAENHAEGVAPPGKSIFDAGVDLLELVDMAKGITPTAQTYGQNFQRVVEAGQRVGKMRPPVGPPQRTL
jgi:RHS repeat-associated protein